MFFENELTLLCNTFQKSQVPATLMSLSDPEPPTDPDSFEGITRRMILQDIFSDDILARIEPNTVYKLKNGWSLSYLFLLLPETATDTLLVFGPYAPAPITDREILEICEKNGASPKTQRAMAAFCTELPVIPSNSSLFVLLDCFCEEVWSGSDFSVIDLNVEQVSDLPLLPEQGDDPDKTLLDMQNLEMRYKMENELLNAVARGQMLRMETLFSEFSIHHFEMRTTDPLRNAKNYCIIMNTLLRKAAEQGGVHPLYLDRTSSRFAKAIEQVASEDQFPDLMTKMFHSYCRLVRKHSTRDYSAPVQQVIVTVDADLSADLSLNQLAARIGVSGAYLSFLFKKEVGKTITEYVRDKRMKMAGALLQSTSLQVQTVALHCGIEDVQYFSKLFKKQFGVSPKKYREQTKKQ